MLDMLTRQATRAELSIATVGVASPDDLDAAFAELARQRPGALWVLTDNILAALAGTIIVRALEQRVPTFGSFRFGFVEAGALFTYNSDAKESYRSVARVLKKILNGATPADIPVD